MKVVIDACVLFPTILRGLVIGWADTGAFTPLWSERILKEWRRAALRHGEQDAQIAGVEIALLSERFPDASVDFETHLEDSLSLPDPNDRHVLAAAISGGSDELLTLNTKDFPTNALGNHGILRRHPDEFLLEGFHSDPNAFADVVNGVFDRAAQHGIDTSNRRALLKRARLPRLGKALDQV